MIRRASFFPRFVRALLLGITIAFTFRLTMAEVRYARGWPPFPLSDATFVDLQTARTAYPFERRFRDGPTARFKLFVETGR